MWLSRVRPILLLSCAFCLAAPAAAVDLVINSGGPATFDSAIYGNLYVYDQGCTTAGCSSTPTILDVLAPANAASMRLHGSTLARFLGGNVGTAIVTEDAVLEIHADGLGSVQVSHRGGVVLESGTLPGITVGGSLVDTSRLQVDGGRISTVTATRLADVTMNGGVVTTMDLGGRSGGTFTMTDGWVSYLFLIGDGDQDFFIDGGVIGDGIYARTGNRVFVRGGSIQGGIWARMGAYVEIRGGRDITELRTQGDVDDMDSLIEIHGRDFAVDGVPVPFGDLTAASGTLTGTLANGDALSVSFLTNGTTLPIDWFGTIRLIEAPLVPGLPPGARVALFVLLLGAAVLVRRHLAPS